MYIIYIILSLFHLKINISHIHTERGRLVEITTRPGVQCLRFVLFVRLHLLMLSENRSLVDEIIQFEVMITIFIV